MRHAEDRLAGAGGLRTYANHSRRRFRLGISPSQRRLPARLRESRAGDTARRRHTRSLRPALGVAISRTIPTHRQSTIRSSGRPSSCRRQSSWCRRMARMARTHRLSFSHISTDSTFAAQPTAGMASGRWMAPSTNSGCLTLCRMRRRSMPSRCRWTISWSFAPMRRGASGGP